MEISHSNYETKIINANNTAVITTLLSKTKPIPSIPNNSDEVTDIAIANAV